jgi:hypothetical protein
MGTVVLPVKEERLEEVVKVIQTGLDAVVGRQDISPEVWEGLHRWCVECREYLTRLRTVLDD